MASITRRPWRVRAPSLADAELKRDSIANQQVLMPCRHPLADLRSKERAGDVMSGEHVRDQDWHARTGWAEEMSDLCRIKVLCCRERGPRVRIFGASAALRGPPSTPKPRLVSKNRPLMTLSLVRWTLPRPDLPGSRLAMKRCCPWTQTCCFICTGRAREPPHATPLQRARGTHRGRRLRPLTAPSAAQMCLCP